MFDIDNADFWDNCKRDRPAVPDSLFDTIYNYHAAHNGQFNLAHDAGAGPGLHSARLKSRFKKVLVTDASSANLEYARSHLDENGFVFHPVKLEDSADVALKATEDGQGVDLIFAATMLHFCDLDRALEAVARQLKPGGTFAGFATAYFFMDDEHGRTLWTQLLNEAVRATRIRAGPALEKLAPIARIAASAYDGVPLPQKYFEAPTRRIKINFDGDPDIIYHEMTPPELREELPNLNALGEHDVTEWGESEDWRGEKDIKQLRGLLNTIPVDLSEEKQKKIWREIEGYVGDRVMKGRWVAWLLLATRRKDGGGEM